MSPYASVEARRQSNRDWHSKQRDGQCEATTTAGTRCPWQGAFDGLHSMVLCNLHANRIEKLA